MLPRLWLLVGSDRPRDQGTDRQCQLLSCPGQLKNVTSLRLKYGQVVYCLKPIAKWLKVLIKNGNKPFPLFYWFYWLHCSGLFHLFVIGVFFPIMLNLWSFFIPLPFGGRFIHLHKKSFQSSFLQSFARNGQFFNHTWWSDSGADSSSPLSDARRRHQWSPSWEVCLFHISHISLLFVCLFTFLAPSPFPGWDPYNYFQRRTCRELK